MNQYEEERMEVKAEIREVLRKKSRVIQQTGDRTSQEIDIAKARLTEKSKLQKRVKGKVRSKYEVGY